MRVVRGPAYLRPIALREAIRVLPPNPSEVRVQTITFPAAFELIGKTQYEVVKNLVSDELSEVERAVRATTGDSPEDQRKLQSLKEKLAELQHKQSLVQATGISIYRPEREWKAEVLRHRVTEFRKQYQGKLGTNTALEAQYTQLQQALAAAEKDLALGDLLKPRER